MAAAVAIAKVVVAGNNLLSACQLQAGRHY
jgi:hypothetical protein